MLEPVSHTFHGRDIFSPAAAHLASGVELAELGPALDPAALVRLELPRAAVGAGAGSAQPSSTSTATGTFSST